ncbi:MAG: intradiol ring-cleavage dioxygenase [Acidimicrobiales bacterium]|nr:intradiol ring-cleavage dioxygenase [Acidimicrobiales bacterium]
MRHRTERTTHDRRDDDPIEDHDRGLSFDLSTLIDRRRILLGAAGGGALALLAACGSSARTASTNAAATSTATADTTAATTATTSPATAASTAAATAATAATPATAATIVMTAVPEETAGPYPGDGSNGVQVLTESGIVRSNIRTSFGSSTTDAGGVPTTLQMTLIDRTTGDPLVGAAVYVWHVDSQGRYSLYSQGATGENYLRGVQESDPNGLVTFQSYYPACYDGRWPHIHYEVYPSLAGITSASNKIATSQLAMPDEINKLVYAESSYASSPSAYARVSLNTDMVFSDGTTNEAPTVTGSVTDGYTMTITTPISV